MGYTHYFPQQRAFTGAEWDSITSFATALCASGAHILANWSGDEGTAPTINETEISFNGRGIDSHESFRITKKCPKPGAFHFCKTAHKPYDSTVTALLTYVKGIAPGALSISSDGYASEWNAGVDLANSLSGLAHSNPIGA